MKDLRDLKDLLNGAFCQARCVACARGTQLQWFGLVSVLARRRDFSVRVPAHASFLPLPLWVGVP